MDFGITEYFQYIFSPKLLSPYWPMVKILFSIKNFSYIVRLLPVFVAQWITRLTMDLEHSSFEYWQTRISFSLAYLVFTKLLQL